MNEAFDETRIWDFVLAQMREGFREAEQRSAFESMCVDQVAQYKIKRDEAVLVLINRHCLSWIEENYQSALEDAFSRALGSPCKLRLRVKTESTAPSAPPSVQSRNLLSPQMTFESFIVGGCNLIAHAAAKTIAENSVPPWNPLYIYGATGLGKTHLLHAIGHAIMARDPGACVVYVTAEDFVNEYVHNIRNRTPDAFRVRFREEATVLLFDDVQFLSGKSSTQEELFYVFNALSSRRRQVVFTSDVEPKAIEGLEDRLVSRFQGGQVVDVHAPDYETARAILDVRVADSGFVFEPALSDLIARRVLGNVRELIGIFNRITFLAKNSGTLTGDVVTVAFAKAALPDFFKPERTRLEVSEILQAAARAFNLKVSDLTGKSRSRRLVEPRHIAMYLARQYTECSLPQLGEAFGGRDHSTIHNGVQRIQSRLDGEDADLSMQIGMIEGHLGVRRS